MIEIEREIEIEQTQRKQTQQEAVFTQKHTNKYAGQFPNNPATKSMRDRQV